MNLFGARVANRRRKETSESDRVIGTPDHSTVVAEVPPSSEEVIEAYQQWWREAASSGARFRINEEEVFPGYQFGEPFLYVRLVEDAADGDNFDTVATQLYFSGAGGILCREGWSETQTGNLDCLWLSYGAIVDYRINGELVSRTPSTLGWHVPADTFQLQFSPPDFRVLLPFQRYIMAKRLEQIGMKDPRVILITDPLGNRSLVFNLHASFPNDEVAMHFSAFVNWMLPKYYAQTVFTDDYDCAVYPLQPFEADSEEELLEQLHYAEAVEERARATARFDALLDADAVPTPGEKRWREMALLPETRFQVNLDHIVYGEFGAPCVVVRVAAPGQSGHTFREAALLVADKEAGALLCGPEWRSDVELSEQEIDAAQLPLSLGDLVDFLMTDNLAKRRLLSEGWLRPMEYYVGRFSEPDVRLLPLQSRRGIATVLRRVGITEPKVALQTLPEGGRLLHFSGFQAVGRDSKRYTELVEAIGWCLPRHYTVFLIDTDRYLPFDLWPHSDTPSDRYIDLDEEDEDHQESQ